MQNGNELVVARDLQSFNILKNGLIFISLRVGI